MEKEGFWEYFKNNWQTCLTEAEEMKMPIINPRLKESDQHRAELSEERYEFLSAEEIATLNVMNSYMVSREVSAGELELVLSQAPKGFEEQQKLCLDILSRHPRKTDWESNVDKETLRKMPKEEKESRNIRCALQRLNQKGLVIAASEINISEREQAEQAKKNRWFKPRTNNGKTK